MEATQNDSQKITPCLWFNGNAEEAIQLYTTVFKNSRVKNKSHYGDAGPGKKGSLLTAILELNGQDFMLLNGGPQYQFTPAVSFMISCETQEEVDHYWNALSEGGREDQCGWLQDRFGLSWQVVPRIMGKLMSSTDSEQSSRVMQAMFKMKKLDIAVLQQAYDGVPNGTEVA